MNIRAETARVIRHFRHELKQHHEHELDCHVGSHMLGLIIGDE
jgi:hypothetical protein